MRRHNCRGAICSTEAIQPDVGENAYSITATDSGGESSMNPVAHDIKGSRSTDAHARSSVCYFARDQEKSLTLGSAVNVAGTNSILIRGLSQRACTPD